MIVLSKKDKLPKNTIFLQWWKTPIYCKNNLPMLYRVLEIYKNSPWVKKSALESIVEQIEQYKAISLEKDWDNERNWQLAWIRPRDPVEILLIHYRHYPDWKIVLGDKMVIRTKQLSKSIGVRFN